MKIQVLFIFILGASLLTSCQPSQRILEDARRNAPPPEDANTNANTEEKRDDFESRLKSVQTGDFQFIYSFRRLDGAVLEGDDKRYLRANSPRDTNQWIVTTDEKAAIAGSNYKFTPENLENLRKRFDVKDYSVANTNSEAKP